MNWYLGLDQSSSHTGVALTDGSIILCTDFRTKERLPMQEKLFLLEDFLHQCCMVEPAKVFTESVFTPSARLKAFSVLLKVEATIHNYLYRNKYPFESLSSNKNLKDSWPRKLGIDGTKEHVHVWLKSLGVEIPNFITDHELDAVGILLGGLVKNGILKEANSVAKIPLVRYTANVYLERLHEYLSNRNKTDNILYETKLLSGVPD